jgi:hypothetical protein
MALTVRLKGFRVSGFQDIGRIGKRQQAIGNGLKDH